jgi:hypothetical protein
MALNQMGNFSFNHVDQQDDLYKTKTAAEIKQLFDSRGNELKTAFNALITALQSTTTDNSGAENIGIQTIPGVAGNNVQSALEDLRLLINSVTAGGIPDGSITEEKLAFEIATDATSVSITDTANHFTATNVEGALSELFTSANSVKTNVSGAIGSPATANDTGLQLAGHITTEKGRLSSTIGDGASSNSLAYLIDRLLQRRTDIAFAVNNKGVPATSADTLAQLVTKVSQIAVGKQGQTGTSISAATTSGSVYYNFSVTGLGFKPDLVFAYSKTGGSRHISFFADLRPLGATLSVRGFHDNALAYRYDEGGNAVTSDGFTLSVGFGSSEYKWIAIKL